MPNQDLITQPLLTTTLHLRDVVDAHRHRLVAERLDRLAARPHAVLGGGAGAARERLGARRLDLSRRESSLSSSARPRVERLADVLPQRLLLRAARGPARGRASPRGRGARAAPPAAAAAAPRFRPPVRGAALQRACTARRYAAVRSAASAGAAAARPATTRRRRAAPARAASSAALPPTSRPHRRLADAAHVELRRRQLADLLPRAELRVPVEVDRAQSSSGRGRRGCPSSARLVLEGAARRTSRRRRGRGTPATSRARRGRTPA